MSKFINFLGIFVPTDTTVGSFPTCFFTIKCCPIQLNLQLQLYRIYNLHSSFEIIIFAFYEVIIVKKEFSKSLKEKFFLLGHIYLVV